MNAVELTKELIKIASTPWKGADAIAAMAEAIVAKAIEKAKQTVPGITAAWQITGNRPYIEKEESSALLKLLTGAHETVTQSPAVVSFFPGYTDTAVIAGTLNPGTVLPL